MAPKIEEIISKPRRNPFEAKPKKATVKREASEVYPQRKGLHKPENVGDKPIDLKFQQLEKELDGPVDRLSVSELYHRMFNDSRASDYDQRYSVVERLLQDLIDIQKYSEQNVMADSKLIKISLHDIKTFSKVVNLVLIHGIYPVLSAFKIGIPIEKRQMNHFSTPSQLKITQLPASSEPSKRYEPHYKLLVLIYEKFRLIFSTESDVKDLLVKGTGFSDYLVISIALITCPYICSDFDKKKYASEFQSIISIPETFELFQTYSLLIATPSPAYFKSYVMNQLTILHYNAPNGDGLVTLIEFVLGLRENDDISVEKFEQVANVVLRKPKEVSSVDYFAKIGQDSYTLLVNINRPTITSCVGYVIEKLWYKNQAIVRDFFFKQIWNRFNPEGSKQSKVLVSEAEVNNNINVLISLTKRGLDPELTQYLVDPILLPLWSYAVFLQKNEKQAEVVMGILVSYFTVTSSSEGLDTITKNLLWESDTWKYEIGPNGLVQIAEHANQIDSRSKDSKMNTFINDLDRVCGYLVELLKQLDNAMVQGVFIRLLKRWLNQGNTTSIDSNPFFMLIDLRLLEQIGQQFKDILANTPSEVLLIVNDFLKIEITAHGSGNRGASSPPEEADSDDEDEDEDHLQLLPVLLELVSAILSETPSFDDTCVKLIKEIKGSLIQLVKLPISETSQKSSQALSERITTLLDGSLPTTTQKDKDTQQLKRAITSLNDPLVPIRAHGLYLLKELIIQNSEVISLDFVLNLHLVQLKDPEPYIYLNVIKGLRSLMDLHPEETINYLTDVYVNKNNDTDLDERLKVGEAILGYIQDSNQFFSGKSAKTIVDATLGMIRVPKNPEDSQDIRIRMSSMSLLGTMCKVNPIGIVDSLDDILDCAIGIIQLETSKDSAIMRRSAIVLIHDLILGTSESSAVPFPNHYREKVMNVLRYVHDHDNDVLVREQSGTVLDTIQELISLGLDLIREQQS